MDNRLESVLIECLDALEMGESLDQVLARFPHETEQLRPILETAVHLSKLNVQPTLSAQSRSREAFLSQAATLKEAKTTRPSPWFNLRRILMPIVSLALILIVFAAGLGPLSASALPGDALYGAKRLAENARLAFTVNPAEEAALVEQFNQRRIQEINALLVANRNAPVAFFGEIESILPDSWVISGVNTRITGDTQIVGGSPIVGQMAMVDGRTQTGRLVASTITLSPLANPPTIMPTDTAVPTATTSATPDNVPEDETATPTPSATPTAAPTTTPTTTTSPTPTETATPEPSPTDTLQPSDTPQPSPTMTPIPTDDSGDDSNDNADDNGNDNADDNGNDNSDDNDNGDDDSDDNDNDNDNGNDNSDDNGNDNDDDNDNSDDNSNDNDNDDSNDNSDDDDNENGDDGDGNSNSNDDNDNDDNENREEF